MEKYPANYISTTCRITEAIAPTAFYGKLPNGKTTVAFLQKKEAHLSTFITSETVVNVRISPADLDQARIMSIAESV